MDNETRSPGPVNRYTTVLALIWLQGCASTNPVALVRPEPGAFQDLPKAISHANDVQTEFAAAANELGKGRYAVGTTALALGAGAAGAAVFDGSNNLIAGLGLGSATLFAFDQYSAFIPKARLYDEGNVAIQCAIQSALSLDNLKDEKESLESSVKELEESKRSLAGDRVKLEIIGRQLTTLALSMPLSSQPKKSELQALAWLPIYQASSLALAQRAQEAEETAQEALTVAAFASRIVDDAPSRLVNAVDQVQVAVRSKFRQLDAEINIKALANIRLPADADKQADKANDVKKDAEGSQPGSSMFQMLASLPIGSMPGSNLSEIPAARASGLVANLNNVTGDIERTTPDTNSLAGEVATKAEEIIRAALRTQCQSGNE